jgi:hypothetical protein
MKSILIPTLSLLLGASVQADTRMKVRYTTGSESTETVVASKAPRQRLEYTNNIVIQQPDLNRFLQVDPKAKTYLIVPMNASVPTPAAAPAPSRRGSVVNVSITVTNTGETKQMLGRVARHIKTVTVQQPMSGACDATPRTTEVDGWYIDLPGAQSPATQSSAAAVPEPACRDQYQYQNSGEPNTGFAVAYTMTLREGAKTTATSMEVLDLATEPLDAALFDAPAGYAPANDLSDFVRRQSVAATAEAPAKAAGAQRVGLAGVVDNSGRGLNGDYLATQLQQALHSAGVDVVRAFDTEQAKKAGCDFLLVSEITQLKKSAIGQMANQAAKVSGLLRGGFGRAAAPSPASSDEQVEAFITYRLTPLAEGKSDISGTVSAKTGTMISLRTAITLASNVTPMLMMAQMASSMYSLQGMSQAMGGQQSMGMDPALSSLSSWNMAANTMASKQAPPASEAKAINAALDLEAKGIASAAK